MAAFFVRQREYLLMVERLMFFAVRFAHRNDRKNGSYQLSDSHTRDRTFLTSRIAGLYVLNLKALSGMINRILKANNIALRNQEQVKKTGNHHFRFVSSVFLIFPVDDK